MPFLGSQTKLSPVWLRVQHLFVAKEMPNFCMTISIRGLNISRELDAYIPNLSNHSFNGVYAVYFWGWFQA